MKRTNKPIKVLIMSVGPYSANTTAHFFNKIGGKDNCVVCLPFAKEYNADTYTAKGFEVFLYDEKKYINTEFEYFGFNRCNCGGVGRQGIAEAVDKYGDDYMCIQIDDDTSSIAVRPKGGKQKNITKWENFEKLYYAYNDFYEDLHIEMMSKTGATPNNDFVANRKIFNNFIMRKGNDLNYDGFKALCSDDYRYNYYRNIVQGVPMLSCGRSLIMFKQAQGDRKDGNAPLYNGDCSWKKAFALKMMFPWAVNLKIAKETNRMLFREEIAASKLYPPISLTENGNIVAKVI